jgi:hypothetical protein
LRWKEPEGSVTLGSGFGGGDRIEFYRAPEMGGGGGAPTAKTGMDLALEQVRQLHDERFQRNRELMASPQARRKATTENAKLAETPELQKLNPPGRIQHLSAGEQFDVLANNRIVVKSLHLSAGPLERAVFAHRIAEVTNLIGDLLRPTHGDIVPITQSLAQGKVMQPRVRGLEFDALDKEVQFRALEQTRDIALQVERSTGLELRTNSVGKTTIKGMDLRINNDHLDSFRYDRQGRVTQWIDPIYARVTSPEALISQAGRPLSLPLTSPKHGASLWPWEEPLPADKVQSLLNEARQPMQRLRREEALRALRNDYEFFKQQPLPWTYSAEH